MNYQEETLLNEIIMYVNKNNIMPTRRYLQNKLHYKSVNSITQYLKSLIKKNYLKYNDSHKLILNDYSMIDTNIKTINILNEKNKYLNIMLNKRKEYYAYKITNNYFQENGIFKNDLLVIEKVKILKSNNIGLFIIDNKYRIMNYNYIDGFYILKDNEEIILNKVNIVGKVIMIIRTI